MSSKFKPFITPEQMKSFSQKVGSGLEKFLGPTLRRSAVGGVAGMAIAGPVGAAIGGALSGAAPALSAATKGVAKGAELTGKALGYGVEKFSNVVKDSYVSSTAEMLGASAEQIASMKGAKVERGLLSTSIVDKTGKELYSGSHLKSLGGFTKNTYSHLKGTALFSGAMYGLMGYATYNSDAELQDKALHVGKYTAAAATDIAAFGIAETVGTGLSMLGPMGVVAAGAITAGNMALGFAGLDPASLVLKFADASEERFDRIKNGTHFNMTSGSAQALQRHLSSLQSSGSNVAEAMHN